MGADRAAVTSQLRCEIVGERAGLSLSAVKVSSPVGRGRIRGMSGSYEGWRVSSPAGHCRSGAARVPRDELDRCAAYLPGYPEGGERRLEAAAPDAVPPGRDGRLLRLLVRRRVLFFGVFVGTDNRRPRKDDDLRSRPPSEFLHLGAQLLRQAVGDHSDSASSWHR